MRKVKYFEHEISVEEYIKIQIVKNDGIRSLVYRQDLLTNVSRETFRLKLHQQRSSL